MKKHKHKKSKFLWYLIGIIAILLTITLALAMYANDIINSLTDDQEKREIPTICKIDSDCNDQNTCTGDKCVNNSCIYSNLQDGAFCDNNDPCSIKDICQDGKCIGGQEKLKCNDNNICTEDSCVPYEGCTYKPNQKPCDDNNKCTSDDICKEGVCTGKQKECDDDDDDTEEWCDKSDGLCKYKSCTTYYYDEDNDGFGVNSKSKCLFSSSGKYTATKKDDCNDNNKDINPLAKETCDAIDNDCDGQIDEEGAISCTTYYYDNDLDHYGLSSNGKCLCASSGNYKATSYGDCNDNNKDINPSVVESCNGLDDDCDGLKDEEGATSCKNYAYDYDMDTYGSSSVKCLCAPSGYYTASNTMDCNDYNKYANPFMVEKCDTIDNDCDGLKDEEGATGCFVFYYDGDGDAYGTTGLSKCLCSASGAYRSTNNDDCDDHKESINPGANEVCNGLDDDCDGQIDETGAVGCTTYYFDFDGDNYGTSSSMCLCSPSGWYDTTKTGDCNDANININPGVHEICGNHKDDNCNTKIDEAPCL